MKYTVKVIDYEYKDAEYIPPHNEFNSLKEARAFFKEIKYDEVKNLEDPVIVVEDEDGNEVELCAFNKYGTRLIDSDDGSETYLTDMDGNIIECVWTQDLEDEEKEHERINFPDKNDIY